MSNIVKRYTREVEPDYSSYYVDINTGKPVTGDDELQVVVSATDYDLLQSRYSILIREMKRVRDAKDIDKAHSIARYIIEYFVPINEQ